MRVKNSLQNKIRSKILRSRRNVFLRADFKDISSDYDQIGRALRQLIQKNILIKIGYGLYAKARINRITGKPTVAAKGGANQVIQEALNRLNVGWEPAIEETGNQIPANLQVMIKDRFSRKISFNKFKLKVKTI